MAWKVETIYGGIHTDNFRDIDMTIIKTISTDAVRILEIDMLNGNVSIDGQLQTRQAVMNHYNKGPYKAIQYRKVVNLIGMYDFEKMEEELAGKEGYEVLQELLRKRRENTINEFEMKMLAEEIGSYTSTMPFKEFEVQTIGYAYNFDNKKVQVEFTCDPEINSIMMTETVTDLITNVKEAPYRIRLI